MSAITVRIRFHGRVQGVNFRRRTRDQADILNVSGWVRNMPDGSVEAEFSGEENSVRDLILYCSSDMPVARVDRVESSELEYREYGGFEIRY